MNENNVKTSANINEILSNHENNNYIFYMLQFKHKTTGISFFKYGITNNSVEARFINNKSEYIINVIVEIYGTKQYIETIEKIHLHHTKNDKFNFERYGLSPIVGETECRNSLVLSLPLALKPDKNQQRNDIKTALGRPKLAKKANKKAVLYINDDEEKELTQLAKSEGLTKSSFMRKIFIEYLNSTHDK